MTTIPQRGDLIRIRQHGEENLFRIVDVQTTSETMTVDGVEVEAPAEYQPRGVTLELAIVP